MSRIVGHVLHDILEAIGRIETITRDRTFDDYVADWQLRYIVERGIEIISEASRGIPDDLRAGQPEIPWNSVRNIGNVLRHEYRSVNEQLMWRVVVDELPRLRRAVEAIRAADRQSRR